MSRSAIRDRARRNEDGTFKLEGWRDGELPNEPVLASGLRITAREFEVLDSLIVAGGERGKAAAFCGMTVHGVEYHIRQFCRKLGLGSPRGLQAMLYRAKMIGALEALNGMRHTRGYPIRDLYEASIALGPDHPLFSYLNPPRFPNGFDPSVEGRRR